MGRALRRNDAIELNVEGALDVLRCVPPMGVGKWQTTHEIAVAAGGVSVAFTAQVLAMAYERGLLSRSNPGHGEPVKWARG